MNILIKEKTSYLSIFLWNYANRLLHNQAQNIVLPPNYFQFPIRGVKRA